MWLALWLLQMWASHPSHHARWRNVQKKTPKLVGCFLRPIVTTMPAFVWCIQSPNICPQVLSLHTLSSSVALRNGGKASFVYKMRRCVDWTFFISLLFLMYKCKKQVFSFFDDSNWTIAVFVPIFLSRSLSILVLGVKVKQITVGRSRKDWIGYTKKHVFSAISDTDQQGGSEWVRRAISKPPSKV